MALLRSAALVLCGASIIAGCGSGAGPSSTGRGQPVASVVCAGAGRAASGLLGVSPHVRVADADPTNIECLISGRGVAADVVAQASAVAWTEYDTAYVHLAQAFGPGGAHNSAEQPHPVPGMSGNAAWVPAQSELIATNGTQSSGGSYVTVTLTGSRHLPRGTSAVQLAAAVAKPTLATAPRGGSPGPPPS